MAPFSPLAARGSSPGDAQAGLLLDQPEATVCRCINNTEHPLSIILGYDPVTLREKVDLQAAGDRLDELGNLRSLSALNEKIGLLRLVGRLDEALDVAQEAIRQARFTGNREDLLAARIRHAQVLQFQGNLDAALTELSACLDEAQSHGWAELEAFASHHRGKVRFDQQDYAAALVDFKAAASLRERHAPKDELESSMIAVAVVESFLDEQANAPH